MRQAETDLNYYAGAMISRTMILQWGETVWPAYPCHTDYNMREAYRWNMELSGALPSEVWG